MSLKISNKPDSLITVGHGEYIVYHQDGKGNITAPDRSTYDNAYTVFVHLNTPLIDHRYDLIRDKIKSIDPSLDITFIPRTYYELHYLKKCIKEDLKKGDYCRNERWAPDSYHPTDLLGCWHLAYFTDEEDNQAEGIKVLAFNMNTNLVKKIKKHLKGQPMFTFQKIMDMCNRQIKFFNYLHFDIDSRKKQGQFCAPIFSEGTPIDKFSSSGIGMAIRSATDAEIIRNAIALECHRIAEKSFLLYRGSEFPTDLPYNPPNPNEPYSFSIGSGLFAGALYREGATPFVYMKSYSDSYIFVIPAQDLQNSPFVIPKKHTLCQLSAYNGTVFHPRTKIWRTTGPIFGGLNIPYVALGWNTFADPFFSPHDKETLTDQVLNFKHRNVVFLNSPRHEIMTVPIAFQPAIHIYAQIPRGSNLYIRGNEGGLSWNKGQPLIEIEDNHWIFRISKEFESLEYKLLVNDQDEEPGGTKHSMKTGCDVVEAVDFKLPLERPQGKRTRLSIRGDASKGTDFMIHGTGPGMTWQRGVDLKKIGDDLWIWETSRFFNNFEYKVVINNNLWECGPNHRVQYGQMEEVFTRFA